MIKRIAAVVGAVMFMLAIASGTASAGTRVTGVPTGMTHNAPAMTHDCVPGPGCDMTHN